MNSSQKHIMRKVMPPGGAKKRGIKNSFSVEPSESQNIHLKPNIQAETDKIIRKSS